MPRRRKALTDRLYQRGRVWWIWGYDNRGTRWFESTRQTERKAALAAARDIEQRRSVPTDRAADAFTLKAALMMILAEDRRSDARPKTVKFHQDKARHLIRVLGSGRRIATLTLADTNSYTDTRLAEGADRHTVQKEIRVLLQALYLAKSEGVYAGEPAHLKPAAFKKRRNYYQPREVWLTAYQAQSLIDHTSTGPQTRINRKPHVAAYLHLGVRKDELYQIEPEHVQLAARTVWVDGSKTDGSARIVQLSDTATALLRHKLRNAAPGRPLFEPWPSAARDLTAAYERAKTAERLRLGLDLSEPLPGWPEHISFNDLRRTFCSMMATAGVPMQHCARLLGHASLDMVMLVYARLAPESLQDAVDQLPALAIDGVTVGVTSQLRETSHAAQDELGSKSETA